MQLIQQCHLVISCEPIDAATVLSTLAHALESSPDWSWEHYCQEEEKRRRPSAKYNMRTVGWLVMTVRMRTVSNTVLCRFNIERKIRTETCQWRNVKNVNHFPTTGRNS